DFETADDDIYSESIDSLDKEKIALNLPADEPTSSINLEELGITDLYSGDSIKDSTEGSDFELLNSILSKAEESDDTQKYSSEEAIDTNDTDEVLDSLLSKVEIADDEILDSILDETPEPVTDRPITTEAIRTVETKKYDDKTYPSKAASPDYSAALKKNIRYVSHDINKLPTKIETRKSGSFLAIAATVAIIAIATWIYFKEDKIKTKSIPTNIIKYDQTRSPIAQDEKIISAQDHSEDTYDSKIIDTETTAQSRTEFSQPQHIETDYVSPVYPDTPEYIDDSAITDIETATQTSTEPSPPQDIEADYVSPVYPDTSESIDDSAMTDIETPAQTSTEPSPPQDIEADYAGPDYPDSSIYTDDSIVSTPSIIEIDEAEEIKTQPETTEAVDENNIQSETVLIEPVISDQVISTKSKSQSWALNLSSIFATRKPAEEIVNLLHSKNIPAEIKEITINGKVWNRIRIRGFDSKQDALDYMKVIRQHTDIKKYWINRLHTQPEQ
ncbi:MAG: SPOR domain-containing protein, partial [Gammaproteobacteria bacterium]|nr:SPOR domain-containing protein [Gammaproteobacteria bacterium]